MDPTLQQPQSPPALPNEGAPAPMTEMPQDQMRANLQGMMSKIEGKYQDFNSSKFASGNKSASQKSDVLIHVFGSACDGAISLEFK